MTLLIQGHPGSALLRVVILVLVLVYLRVSDATEKTDPSILLIGGAGSNGTVEEYDLSTMTSEIITRHGELDGMIRATPVNDTHAVAVVSHAFGDAKTYYIDRKGEISPGAVKTVTGWSDIVSLCDANGRRQVVSCGRMRCKVLSEDGRSFEEHSSMTTLDEVETLTAFGKELIAVGQRGGRGGKIQDAAERYDGSKWKQIQSQPSYRYCSAAVKLNGDQLLSCGGLDNYKACFVYSLGSDTWNEGPEAKSTLCFGELTMVGQTVYAFGGYDDADRATSTIQTLDVSSGIEKAEWQLKRVPMKVKRRAFGIWVVGGSNVCQTTTTGKPTMVTDQGLSDPTTVTTSGSMVTDGHLTQTILLDMHEFMEELQSLKSNLDITTVCCLTIASIIGFVVLVVLGYLLVQMKKNLRVKKAMKSARRLSVSSMRRPSITPAPREPYKSPKIAEDLKRAKPWWTKIG